MRPYCLSALALMLLASPAQVAGQGADTVRYHSRAELSAAVAPAATAENRTAVARLGDRGAHSYLVIRRDQTGEAEVHRDWDDVVVVHEGAATLLHGGISVGGRETAPGEIRGGTIEGAARIEVGAGDLIVIPAGVPHQVQVAPGGSITYLITKVRTGPPVREK